MKMKSKNKIGLDYFDVSLHLLKESRKKKYQGLDPSTIRFNPRLLKLINILGKITTKALSRKIIYKMVFILGHRLNFLLKPDICVFSKGLGLNLSAYSNLLLRGRISKEEYNDNIDIILGMLLNKKLNEKYLWAHDYNYFIKGVETTTTTPNLITTAFVALGIKDCWMITKDEKYKKLFGKIVRDMVQTFPFIDYGESGCFMYTPTSNYHVHNANLIMAELLTIYQEIYCDEIYNELINKSIQYSIKDFINTKNFYYAGEPTRNKTVDNYHTGYVIRSLKHIYDYNIRTDSLNFNNTEIKEILLNGLKFYIKNFITKDYVIRDHLGTIESHSLAESILIYNEFYEYMSFRDAISFRNAINNTIILLWDERQKYFYYTVRPIKVLGQITDKTNLIRWSQAWMAYALSSGYDYDDIQKE